MNIVCLVNNWVGWQAVEYLRRQRGTRIVGAIIHANNDQRYGKEIRRALPKGCRIFTSPELKNPRTLGKIAALKADMAVSVFYGYILKPEFIELFPKGCVNVHPGLLPYNQGKNPNVWNIIEETPAGATLHHIDEGVDTGDIIAQQKVDVSETDTGETLYQKLELACVELLKKAWPRVRSGKFTRRKQFSKKGTFHLGREVEKFDEIDLNKSYKARHLINILRARTFPPYKGAFFKAKGKKIYLRLQLLEENEL